MLRDILAGTDAQINAVLAQITNARPDVIILQGIDYDMQNLALAALAQEADYPHHFSAPPNAGRMTAYDMDGDGNTGGPGDAQSYGHFYGQGSMALLSKYPVLLHDVQDHSEMLWQNLPHALSPETDGLPYPSAKARAVQRLSSHGHWVIPIDHPTLGPVTILAYHAAPPVFDGPEDRNGKRNHDETAFWSHYLDGAFGPSPEARFILMGGANLDPDRGEGRSIAMRNLLNDPRLQDPLPGQPTVTFAQTGPMRVDYVLPSADWKVADAKVVMADPTASRHSLVWVDLTR
ncbi:endonuclease/exonuclease/phosphatase family protein [Sulfitobacter sp. F26204]|nr:endonuclease/exonuclease/phosphatase family protein [Sulfitobacter sp. F26204]